MTAIDVVRSLLDALDAHDFARVRTLLADDFTTTPSTTGVPMDRERFLAAHEEVAHALPTLRRHPTDFREEAPGEVALTMRVTLLNDAPVHLPMLGIERAGAHRPGAQRGSAQRSLHRAQRAGRGPVLRHR